MIYLIAVVVLIGIVWMIGTHHVPHFPHMDDVMAELEREYGAMNDITGWHELDD